MESAKHSLNMPKALLCLLLLLVVLLVPVNMPSATAEEGEGQHVASIEVRGNRYVETETVLAQVKMKPGEIFSRATVSKDVRRLHATGFFADVRVVGDPSAGGIRLVYEVTENPLVAELEILGNDEIPDKKLKPKLKLKPGRVLNKASRLADEHTIRRAYLKKGYYQVNVNIETKERKDGRVDVSIHVDEGEVTRIKRIRFVGNQAFSDAELLKEGASKESDFISWMTDRDVFNRERLIGDAQLIEQHYLNHGYLDAKVESTLISLSPDKSWFFLTFSIHEGVQYTVNSINIQGDLVPDRDTLMRAVTLELGEIYSLKKMRGSIKEITTLVGDEGYAFANVTPLFQRDIQARTVDITLDIEKGHEVYIERIEIVGNQKTEDNVVRRELRQIEGERFSASKMDRSKTRLKRVRLFENTSISLPKGSAPDKVHANLKVEESKTGTFSIGAGFSQLEKAFFTVKVEEGNLLGKGLRVNATADVGAKTQNVDASLTDPYFLDEELSATINAFKTQTKLDEIVTYNEDNYGMGVSFGVPLSEHLSYGIGYQFSETNLKDIPVDASFLLRSQAGKQQIGEVSQSLSWDTRDAILAPSSGHFERLWLGVAGLGGDNRFAEVSASSSMYFPLEGDFVFSPSIAARYIRGFNGKTVPIYRRYSLGGVAGSLRGFDSYGVTIRDSVTNEILGGNKTVTASLNLYFPLPYMREAGFRGVLFADAGNVADFSQPMKPEDTRTSAGIAIEWISPIGPLGLVWGFPINKKAGDSVKSFEFALGTSF